MAYKTDGTANFNFFINRQGPRGPQGIQGEQGFSPNVQVEEDQGNTFTLRVTNKDSFFITSNLREHKEDRGGDYLRYDRTGQVMYFGDPNFATTLTTGEVRLSTVDDLTSGSDTVALTPKVYKDDVTDKVNTINESITSAKTELQGDIAATNLKIDNLDAQNVKITGNQTISGLKDFTSTLKTVNLQTSKLTSEDGRVFLSLGGKDDTSDTVGSGRTIKSNSAFNISAKLTANTIESPGLISAHNLMADNGNINSLTSSGEINAVSINAAGIKNNQSNKYYLTQGTVEAGDNITIDETAEGIKISGQAGGGGTNAGLEGDYCSKYGIVDCPNGILTQSGSTLTLQAGVVMQLTETDSLTTNASAMAHTVESTTDFDLFYTSGSLLEATQVVFAEKEPNNGKDGVLAWYNGTQWQFKSNDTGNVWKSAPAVRLAHIHITNGNITGIDYIGNRHLNKVIPVTVDTEQTITGSKTFTKTINFGVNLRATSSIFKLTTADYSDVLYMNQQQVRLGNQNRITIIYGTSIKNASGKHFLTQSSITAGSDNLVISDTTDGIQIVCNAPTNEQFGQLSESIADLSTKINNLTDRVRALEEQIDGGIA